MSVRHDFCPWLFWPEADPAQQQEQLDQQARLAAGGRFRCGQRCYVSPLAGLVPTSVVMGNDCYIAAHAYVTDELRAGDACTINPYTTVRGRVVLGNGVRVGAHASILGFTHNHEDISRPIHQQGLSAAGIVIGDDVWIGSNALVLDGTRIGSHCVIAAGAVVTRDVPDYAVVAGNPARVLRDRRSPRPKNPVQQLRDFGRRAAEQWPGILAACAAQHGDEPLYADTPGGPLRSIRPLNDAIEIAAAFGAVPALQTREQLIARLQALQQADTGMPVDPLAPRPSSASLAELADGNAAYMVLSVGYALECLGAAFARPLSAVQDLSPEFLQRLLASRPWQQNAWDAGGWVDALGTALWMNRRHFGLSGAIAPLFDWLRANCAPHTGLWGESTQAEGWLRPVNGFYRLTRGTYAQFGLPVPHPDAAIDTVLAHVRLNAGFTERNVNACNVLDVVHPLWLLRQQSQHRGDEIRRLMESQLALSVDRWVDGKGFGFAPGQTPGLQGTEMWLSIIYLAADALGMAAELGYSPKGVHRLRGGVDIGAPAELPRKAVATPPRPAPASLPLPGAKSRLKFF